MTIIIIKFNYIIIIFQTNNMKCLCKTISETTRSKDLHLYYIRPLLLRKSLNHC